MAVIQFASYLSDKVIMFLGMKGFCDSSTGDAEDGDEYDDPFTGPLDTVSLASERCDKDDEGPSDGR